MFQGGAPFEHEGQVWEQQKVLGKGSFGQAILVKRKHDGKQAVCKLIHVGSMKPDERAEAQNEVKLLSRLKHPNIVEYYTSFERKGTLFILMEYANASDLDNLIKNRGSTLLSEDEIAALFVQMCYAIKYLHERRILHRDLKAQNVFLSRKKSGGPLIVKLGDFGVSTVLRNTQALARTVCGTPYYFSPELCMNKPYNNKSDVWSLGCILYELATLKHAFDATSMKGLMQRILQGRYMPIASRYSPDLQRLIDAMLQQRALKRWDIKQVIESPFVKRHALRLCNDDLMTTLTQGIILPTASSSASASAAPPSTAPQQKKPSAPPSTGGKKLGPKPTAGGGKARPGSRAKDEMEPMADIRKRAEICSYENQQQYVQGSKDVVRETQEQQQRREEAHNQRESHLEQLKRQMNDIENRMKQRREEEKNPPPRKSAPSDAELARANKQRISVDAPWNQNRAIPVGFTKESWEVHQRVMAEQEAIERVAKERAEHHRAGLGGPAPSHAVGGGRGVIQQIRESRAVTPPKTDPYGGRRPVVSGPDLDEVLGGGRGSNPSAKKEPTEAEKLWAARKKEIRDSTGQGSEPTLTQAQLLWQLQQNKLRQQQEAQERQRLENAPRPDERPLPLPSGKRDVSPQRRVSPQHVVVQSAQAQAVNDDDDDDDYNQVIYHIQHQNANNAPPDLFEEAELPGNEVSRLTNFVKFTLDGKTLHLRECKATDPLPRRVEALRMFLTENLGGTDAFETCYWKLKEIQEGDMDDEAAEDMMERLTAAYGPKGVFIDLMVQLLVCESQL